jgi:hypothetical protein
VARELIQLHQLVKAVHYPGRGGAMLARKGIDMGTSRGQLRRRLRLDAKPRQTRSAAPKHVVT